MSAAADISNEKIRDYNEAVAAATDMDRIMAAALALAEDAMDNPGNETATLLAFEAAWTLCQIGQCDKAGDAAKFASTQTAIPDDGYPSEGTRQVLNSYIDWKTDASNANRNKLAKSLANLEQDDVTQISLAAHREHYQYCTSKGAWRDAAKAAAAAARHTERLKSDIFEDYAMAEYTRISSEFNASQTSRTYEDAIVLRQEVDARIKELHAANPEASIDFLQQLSYEVNAWEGMANAYLVSTGKDRQVRRIREKFPDIDAEPEDTSDFCQGNFDAPPYVTYPQSAAASGRIGSLLVGFTIDNGRTRDVEVLAAVPKGVFDEEAIRAISELTWSPAEGVDITQCSMVRENVVYPLIFSLQPVKRSLR